MATENSGLDIEGTSLNTDVKPATNLSGNPVSEFEDTKRSLLQRSLANANETLQSPIKPHSGELYAVNLKPVTTVTSRVASHAIQPEPKQSPSQAINEDEEEEESGWRSIGRGISNFWGAVCIIGKKAINADWKAIGKTCVKTAGYLAEKAYRGVAYAATHPREVAEFAFNAAKVVANGLIAFGKGAINEAKNMILDPVGTTKRLGSFLKGLSDQLGISDLALGIYHAGLVVPSLLMGGLKGAGEHIKQSTRAVAGALVMVGEFTGISDLGRAFIALSKGEYAKAAFYGALGATQLYLTCTTLGLGNLLSKQGVEAMKRGVRILAKETGQEVVEALEKKISNELLETTGAKIASIAEQIIMRDWAEIARSLFANVKRIVKDTAEKLVEKLMRDNGGKQIVTSATDKLLEKISGSSVKDLAKEFAEHGIKVQEAHYMAKCLKKGLWKQGYRSRYHGILAEEIIDEITGQVRDNFMERGLRKGFERSWKESVARIITGKGLDSNASELLLKAGMEGFEEGVELGIRKVVKEGVEESFKKYSRSRWFQGFRSGQVEQIAAEEELKILKFKEEQLAKKKKNRSSTRWRKRDDDEDIDKKYLDLAG